METLANAAIVPNDTAQSDETPEVQTVEETAKARAKAIDSIKKVYFPSSKLGDAQTEIDRISAICEQYQLKVAFNFDVEKDALPDGYGLGVIPISKRIKNENVTLGVAIAGIPDVETVRQHENGNQFVNDSVVNTMMAKLANATRPRGEDNETAASIPFTIEDFITSNRPEGVLLAFRTYASAYVKVLKKGGLKLLTESILRQALQSKAFAEQQFPKVPQDKWVAILESMIRRAEKDAIAVGLLAEWKQSRDSATLSDDDVDLSDLDLDAIKF